MEQFVMTSLVDYKQKKLHLTNIDLPQQLIEPKLTFEQKDVIDLKFQIDQGKIKVFHSDGSIKSYGWDNFVIRANGELKIGKRHYALGNQKGVWGAGSLMHWQGSVLAVSNNSAHYKPTFNEAQKSYKYLKEVLKLDLSNTLDHSFNHVSPEDFLQKENALRRFWMQQLIDWNKKNKQ